MSPCYLLKRNQTYYYRLRIPSDLAHLVPLKEIKISLKTSNFCVSKMTAAGINAKVQSLFGLLRVGTLDQEQISHLIAPYLPRKPSTKVKAVHGRGSSVNKLSAVIKLFVSDKGVRWTTKTHLEFSCMFDVLVELLGDEDVGVFSRADGLACRDKLMRLPASFRKKSRYKGMSVKQILNAAADDALTPKTINKYLVLLSSLFKWCVKNGMMATNVAEGLSLPEETVAHEQRKAYDRDDLKRIKLNLPRDPREPEKFWIPMIAMYSGMRLDEVCQLHVEDVREVEGVWCFDVNDAGERKVKTLGSKRLVPVHPVLLGLGFRDYVDALRGRGAVKLWENLSPNKYGYWGKGLGKWYSQFNRKHVTTDPKKVFHSFRHLVADTLKQAGVEEGVIAEILGHANQSITTGRYGKRYRPSVLLEALVKLDYGVEF